MLTYPVVCFLSSFLSLSSSFPGDEETFATKNITTCGQSIGMILADTRSHAEAGAAAVVVTYGPPPAGSPAAPIITIADAIAAKSFLPGNAFMQPPPPVTCGNFATAYAAAPYKLTGTNSSVGQTHFYMETQTCYALPGEHDSIVVHSASQGTTDIRGMVMRATGLPAHKVIVTTKRCGGGFGGREQTHNATHTHPHTHTHAHARHGATCSRKQPMPAYEACAHILHSLLFCVVFIFSLSDR